MTETTTTEQKARESKAYFETAIDNVFDIARLWTQHGLNVGKQALDTASESLKKTSDSLNELNARIEKKAKRDA